MTLILKANTQMSNTLKHWRIKNRAEYKIERLSLRGGYRYEQSPYKNKLQLRFDRIQEV
jgi:long-subunit fatty acid transport protein